MTIPSFIKKLFRLHELKITDYYFSESKDELRLTVKPYKNGCCCPQCGRRGKLLNQTKVLRRWDDLVVSRWKIILLYSPKEMLCPTHGRQQEIIPWASQNAQHTYRHEYAILTYAKAMTQKMVCTLLRVSSSTLSDRLHRAITRARKGHKIKDLETIGIDEISYRKGKKYATIVYDLDKGVVLWVGKGKGRSTIDDFFENELTESQRDAITWASCDMSSTYIGAIENYCENATLVLDHFHITKALNDAVDEVRKEAWREASEVDRKALKGLRWLLYRHSSTRSKKQTRILNELRKQNNRIHRAWILKDEFEHFWKYLSTTWAENFLFSWVTKALRSRLDSIKKFARTIRQYHDNIVGFIERNLTNAKGEGLNRIIKIVKNRASGFYNLNSFSDMIYLTVGDVDIPGQIPEKFQTV